MQGMQGETCEPRLQLQPGILHLIKRIIWGGNLILALHRMTAVLHSHPFLSHGPKLTLELMNLLESDVLNTLSRVWLVGNNGRQQTYHFRARNGVSPQVSAVDL